MRTKKMRSVLKWTSYVLFALVLFCFQSAPTKIGIFSQVLYLLPFVVAFSCYEEIIPSVIFAAICGLFWDYSAQRQFGYSALILCLLCVAVWVAMKFFVRPIFVSVAISVCACALIYCILDFFFFFVLRDIENTGAILLDVHLPLFIKTCIFGVGIAFLTEKIYKISPIRAKFDAD